jgi:ATP-dependent DNA helicase RecG
LAFNELLLLEMKNLARKETWQKNKPTYRLTVNIPALNKFINSLPFKLTPSQKRVVKEILNDFQKTYPMNRLLEGDVGSGKTVVAIIAAFITFLNGYQTVYMAPTQILAEQHFNTLNLLLQPFKVRIKLITSQVKKGDLGREDIFIGTHSLIYNRIDFDRVAFVVIDEQHRFGVEQRTKLIHRARGSNLAPHVLTMTATPIPRSVALTFYGDLDLSILTELPADRQTVTTWIVPPQKRESAYNWLKLQARKNKSQVFIVCPLIEESEIETMKDVKAVTQEFTRLKSIFAKQKLGLLHGRLKAKEKTEILDQFRAGKIDVLVATPVVEVGIDVANATIMVIEAAERFGLAELHQLRGRVGRGAKKSYCLLFGQTRAPKALLRLKALQKTLSGFELAEMDLKLRGPGEIFGLKQHGFPGLKIASWSEVELIKKAKAEAEKAFSRPQDYQLLHARLAQIPTSPN